MIQFQVEYPGLFPIAQPPVAQLPTSITSENGQRPVAQLPQETNIVSPDLSASPIVQRTVVQLSWAHNVVLIQKLKHFPTRIWYAQQALEQGWSRNTLIDQIKNRAHEGMKYGKT